MDPPATTKTSNIPRLSKLPIARPNRSSSNSDGSNHMLSLRAAAESKYSRLQPKFSSVRTTATTPLNPAAKDYSEKAKAVEEQITASLNRPLAVVLSDRHDVESGSVSLPTGDSPTSSGSKERQSIPETKLLRKPRPSLSDRTVETLSQIPPSPSPRRRQSGFFTGESPMRPPSRAASAMNHSRPSSRIGLSMTPVRSIERAISPSKGMASASVSVTSGRRAASSYLPRNSISLSRSAHETPGNLSYLESPRQSTANLPPASQSRKPVPGSKTMALRSPGKRAPVQHVFRNERPESSQLQDNSPVQYRNEPRVDGASNANKPSATVSGSRKACDVREVEPVDTVNGELHKISTSSQSLRQTIAKAKAAHQKAKVGLLSSSGVPRSVRVDQYTAISPEVDPFSFDLADNNIINILRKRINTARTDGKLNISALGLTGIPDEVVKMYDYDINNTGGTAWYENVDLIRFNAADNEITELRDDAFPEDVDGGLFAGLQLMDVHGNRIHAVPSGFVNLSQLTKLNLSRNQLTDDAFLIISSMSTLRELHLAENVLRGALPSCISGLEHLEILDIHENAITDLTENLGQLSSLRVLNVAGNKLSSLPFEHMARLPLTEIVASRNRLEGILLPANTRTLPTLRLLDVGRNALVSIMATEVAMPSLLSLDISNNRIACLPSATVWPGLLFLTASENGLTTLPDDLPTLKNLKTLDVGGNNLAKINESIGSMDKLTILNLMNNPLRERKLLKMNTEEIKLELRGRIEAPKVSTTSPRSPPGVSQPVTLWQVKTGVLDKSRCKLASINEKDLLEVAADDEVKSFILNHNILQHFPQALSILSATLTVLDLSHNKLGRNSLSYIEGQVSLPNLQSLNITSNALTSFNPLVESLFAPKLSTLIVLFNRLTALPPLRASFPSLTTLLASNNAITGLDVEAIRGLQTLDVSSNEITHLPAQLALLQGQLKTFMVTGNKFRVPGWGVLEKGTEEILNWCRKRIPIGEEGAVTDDVD